MGVLPGAYGYFRRPYEDDLLLDQIRAYNNRFYGQQNDASVVNPSGVVIDLTAEDVTPEPIPALPAPESKSGV